jgi:hypothetical protein
MWQDQKNLHLLRINSLKETFPNPQPRKSLMARPSCSLQACNINLQSFEDDATSTESDRNDNRLRLRIY